MAVALRHRLPRALINNLSSVGADLTEMTVAESVWLGASTQQILRRLEAVGGRLTLTSISDELERHRHAQWHVLKALEVHSDHFLVCFGLGLAARFDVYATRWSHDIDLLADSPSSGGRIVDVLADEGFSVSEHRVVDGEKGISDWRLDRAGSDGDLLHVDVSCGAVSSSRSWLPPFTLPKVFDQRREVTRAGGTFHVPGDLHQVILLVQKAQRNLEFDARVMNDIAVLLNQGEVDAQQMWALADRHGLTGVLAWLSGESHKGAIGQRAVVSVAARLRPSHRRTRQVMKRLYAGVRHGSGVI